MTRRTLLKSLLASLAFALPSAWAASVTVSDTAPAAMLVQVHADWCGSCKVLDPRVAAMREVLNAQNVLVVKLDYTNEATTQQAKRLAAALSITDAVAANNGTGKLLVIRGDDRSLDAVLTRSNSDDDILNAVKAAAS